MEKEKLFRLISILLCIIFLTGTVYYSSIAMSNYNKMEVMRKEAEDRFSIEVLRIRAYDNTEIKALLYINASHKDLTNRSVPLIIGCHGMSDNYLTAFRTYRTFLSLGYAVLSPEFRGHGSNRESSTLGWKEPYDILDWLNYLEANNKIVNTSNAGIMGHSMGGMYATLAYIYESKAQGRFKALVEQSGVVNLTREIEFLASSTEPIGDIPFARYQEEKSPVNHANSTFPKNVLIIHGNKDTIVDYQCGVDFYNVIDPSGTRDDVEFITMQGHDHSIGNLPEVIKRTVAWMEKYIRGNAINWTEIQVIDDDFGFWPAEHAKEAIFNASLWLIPLIASIVYLIKPTIFSKSWPSNNDNKSKQSQPAHARSQTDANATTESAGSTAKSIMTKQQKLIILAIYFGTILITGLIGLIPNWYLASEIGFIPLLLSVALLMVNKYYKPATDKFSRLEPYLKEKLFSKATIVWIIAYSIGLTLYPLITSNGAIENTYLVPGYRIHWWIPYMITVIASFMTINQLFIACIQDSHRDTLKGRISELGLSFILGFLGIFLWGIWHLETIVNIPAWGIGGNVVPIIALMIGLLAMGGALLSQITEKILKSGILAYMIISAFVPIFVAGTSIIFFY